MQRPTRAVFETPAHPQVRRSLTTELVDALRQQIETAELKVGARLATEAEMVQRFNVSRTVVREALSKLQAAGLVETRHGIGTFVCEAPGRGFFNLIPPTWLVPSTPSPYSSCASAWRRRARDWPRRDATKRGSPPCGAR